MSTYSSEVADWHGSGYGPLLATPSVSVLLPSLSLSASCCCAWSLEGSAPGPNTASDSRFTKYAIRALAPDVKWAVPQAHPGLTAASFPWPSGAAYKLKALTFPYTAGALVYVRDREESAGLVYLGADGLPRIRYWPCSADQASMMKVGKSLYQKQ